METITDKLPKEFKDKWIAALKSVKYKKGTGELFNRANETYCCLGVAGRIANVDESILAIDGYFSDGDDLPDGFPEVLVNCSPSSVSDILIRMNDSEGKSFSEIADWIEVHL